MAAPDKLCEGEDNAQDFEELSGYHVTRSDRTTFI